MRELYNLEGKYIISNAARFTEEKNHAFLIDVFNEVVKEKPNAVLLLMGDGILKEKIEAGSQGGKTRGSRRRACSYALLQ